MKNKRYFLFVSLVIFNLIFWSCSSGPKKVKTVPKSTESSVRDKSKEVKPAAPAQSSGTESENPASQVGTLPVIKTEDLAGETGSEKNGVSGKDEATVYLEEAFTAYQEAQAALEKEEIDGALAKLDESYGLMLKVKTPHDSSLCQEKNDLRILIAQKLQQIYASHLKPAGNNNGTIPLIENKWVQDEIRSFQTKEKRYFEESYKRSGLYRKMILEELSRAGLPEQLSWLPLIESGFKVRALSSAHALGMWQFIRSTGYLYGLKQDKYVDERMDPLKSTRAAIKYLAGLHDFFGDWTTALASYNCGEMRVQNVIRAQKIDYLDNFWDLFNNLPYETARFVPRFIAALLIIENPSKYGFSFPEPDRPPDSETVTISQPVKLASISANLGLEPLLLSFLNPELRYDSTPNYEYALKVPVGYGEKLLTALPSLPRYIPPEAIYGWYIIKKGDTIGAIARRYRTSIEAVMRLNGLHNPRLLRIGQRLKIPGKALSAESPSSSAPQASRQPSQTESPKKIYYTIKEGDTLFTLAKLFNTTVDRIKTDNGLKNESLNVGQKIVIANRKTQPGAGF